MMHQPVVPGQPAPEAEPVPNLVADLPLGRCRLEGMAIDCARAAQVMEGESAIRRGPDNDCGSRPRSRPVLI
ncbi:MAG TPA: hypothetical protein VIP46_11555 [Pyrinomonadaceae bacterium]